MKKLAILLLLLSASALATAQAKVHAPSSRRQRQVGRTTTYPAADCSQTAVQNAVNQVPTTGGGIVTIPAGNCTWSGSGAAVTVSNKAITIVGAGVGQTNITDSISGGFPGGGFNITGVSATNFVDVSQMTFIYTGASRSGAFITIGGPLANGAAFRLHHMRFLIQTCCSRGTTPTNVYGLIDHITFDATTTAGSVQSISPTGAGFASWQAPLEWGTVNSVYIEDNTFNYATLAENPIDAYSGARMVIRHNHFNNSQPPGFHGTDSGNFRSPVSYEIYENDLLNNTATTLDMMGSRGGTGVLYNNRYTGTGIWRGAKLSVYRACPYTPTGAPGLLQSFWGSCDGTQYTLNVKSNLATNVCAVGNPFCIDTTITAGGCPSGPGTCCMSGDPSCTTGTIPNPNPPVKFCSTHRDTLCTADADCSQYSPAEICSAYWDGGTTATGGYPCRDGIGRGPNQQLAPVYIWGNSCNFGNNVTSCPAAYANDAGAVCGVGIANYIQAGRDYVEGTAMPGYIPYVYPHPLNIQTGIGPGAATPVCVADSSGGLSHTLPLTINAGDTVVVGVTAYDGYIGSPFTVTDSSGATYTNPIKTQVGSGAGLAGSYIFVSPTPMTQAATSVIATRSSGSSKFVVCAKTYTGVGGIGNTPGNSPTNASGTNGGNLLTNINNLATGHYIVTIFTASAATATTFSVGTPAAGTFLANASTTTPNTASAMLCENPAAANGVAACNASIPAGVNWSASGIELVPGTSTTLPTILTFGVAPTTIAPGATATLSWTTTNATSASINQGIGSVPVNGSFNVSPSATTTYTLTAANANGSVTAPVTLTVTVPVACAGVVQGVGGLNGTGVLGCTAAAVTARPAPPSTGGVIEKVVEHRQRVRERKHKRKQKRREDLKRIPPREEHEK